MRVVDFLRPEAIVPSLRATNKREVLRELAARLAEVYGGVDPERLLRVLEERERLGSTAIGDGIAIPHGKLPDLEGVRGVFGRHLQGVDFESLDEKPTRLFFLLVAPEDSAGMHLKALARISRLFKDAEFRARLLEAENAEALYELIRAQEEKL
ncbi:MAG: nitrogen regulatory protein [Candidatus Binatia bacterium]|nr:MAG: nitrogen regulatory protein [Candidatus Binatia bacterium]